MATSQGSAVTPRRRPRPVSSGRITPVSGLGLGIGVIWLSLIVLVPIAAIVVTSFQGGAATFWSTVPATDATDTLRLPGGEALLATVFNAGCGALVAWVLVRDRFV